jgi:hypothetical protein
MKQLFLIIGLALYGLIANSQWIRSYTLDDFGDTTDMFTIEGRSFDGLTYYNDPNGEPLDKFCIRIIIDAEKNVGLFIHENCVFDKPAFPGNDQLKEVTFRMRNSEKVTEKINILSKWATFGGLKLEEEKFINFLNNSEGKIRCIVQSGVAYYKFTIDATGFRKIIK